MSATRTMRAVLARVPRRVLVWLALAAAAGIGISVWRLQSGAAAPASLPVVKASRDDVIVSVGGVGRIVQAGASAQIVVPAAVGGGAVAPGVPAPGGGGGASAPADAVFPHASGHVLRFLVAPGQHVAAGQPLALLDDGGSAAAAINQAQNDLATALLELRQKRTSDPLKGLPPTPAELAAGRLAVTSARERLARLLAPPRPAEVSPARLDAKRAEADLETLLGGTLAARAEAIRIAQHSVRLAQERLDRTLAPRNPVDVSAAEAEVKKAEADLAALHKPPPPPLPQAFAAAQHAVTAAKQKLAKLTGPPDPVAVSTAELELKKAEAELAALQKPPLSPLPETLAAAQQAVTAAQQKLAKLTGPPDPVAVSTAELEVKKAEADLAALQPPLSPEALAAAQQAVTVARQNLTKVRGSQDPAEVSAAQLELDKALAELAGLQRPPPAPLPEEIAAAQMTIDTALLKLARVQGPPDRAEVSAAKLELDRALAELAGLQRPPPAPLPKAIAAARQALEAARLKRAKLGSPNPADVTAARLELERARAERRTREAGPSRAALAAARQAVDSSRARLAQLLGPPLRSDITAAQLDVGRAEADLAVLRARGGPASPIDIALARLKVKAARARLTGARFAERLLTVRAPSGGTVTALLTVRGAPVDASTPIAAVADLHRLAVNVDLSEFDEARVRRGLPAVVRVDALGGKSFPGKVLFAALTGTDTGGVVTFPVRVGLAHAGGLKPGMNVSVRIIVAQRREVVQVPLEAVSRDDSERPIVTVIDASGRTSPRRVTLGLANNKNVEIARGLHAGERVVLAESQGEEGD